MDVQTIVFCIVSLVFTFLMTYAITPIVYKLSLRVGAIDIPKDERRMHNKPIPTMGGLAIAISFIFGMLAFVDIDTAYLGLIIGALMITVMGMLDDIYALKAWIKLGVQVGAALIVTFSGVVIDKIAWFDSFIYFGDWAIPVTVLWIVAITNTINLIDGLDGLACGISAISSISLLVVSVITVQNPVIIVIAALLAGSCLGFLPYNLNPAKMFMGDVGAMFLGFVLAVISIQGFFKVNAVFAFVAPFLVLGFPILDMMFAVVRRLLKGQHPFHADRKHFHHRLIDLGLNQKQAVGLMYTISALLGVSAILFSARMYQSGAVVLGISFTIGVINWIIIRKGNAKNKQQSEEINNNDET